MTIKITMNQLSSNNSQQIKIVKEALVRHQEQVQQIQIDHVAIIYQKKLKCNKDK